MVVTIYYILDLSLVVLTAVVFFPVLGFHVKSCVVCVFDLITSLHLNFLCHCVCLCSIVATLPRNRGKNSNNWYQSPRLLGSGLNKLYGKDGEIRY